MEALLDVAPVDVVEGAVEPVGEVLVHGAAVTGDRALPAPGAGGEIVLEGLAQGRDGAGAGALGERVVAQGDAAEDFAGAAARLVGGDGPVAPDDEAAVGRLPSAVAGAVVDEVGAQPGGLNPDAESGELAVPCRVGFLLRLERLDGARGEGHPKARGAFSGRRC